MYAAGQNGGTPVMAMAKENGVFGIGIGVGLAEKRARDEDGSVSPTARPLHVGGVSFAQRGFQDVPEAPPRKRVHVGGSSSSRLNAAKGLHSPSALDESVTKVTVGGMSDLELDRRLPARHPRTPLRTEGITGGVDGQEVDGTEVDGQEVDGQDADAATDVGDRRTSGSLNDGQEEEELANGEEDEEEKDGEEEAKIPNPVTGVTDMDVDVIIPDGVEPEGSHWLQVEDGVQLPVPTREGSSRGAEAEAGVQMDGRYFTKENVFTGALDGFYTGVAVHPPPAPVNGERGLKKESDDRRRDQRPPAPATRRRSIEVIEVEDSDDELAEMNVHESDESSTKGKKPGRMNITDPHRRRDVGHRASSSQSSGSHRVRRRASSSQFSGSYNPEDEDDDGDSDDCQVLESIPPRYGQRDGPSNPVVVDDDEEDHEEDDEEDDEEDEEDASSLEIDSSDSDEEVVVVGQTEIRRQWEEAAMRRGLGRVMRSEGSKANGDAEGGTVNHDEDRTESQGLEESVATSTYHGSPDSKDQTETSEARGGLDGFVNHRSDGQQGASTSSMRAINTATGAAADDVVPVPVGLRQSFPDGLDDSELEIRDPYAAIARPRAPEANGSRRVDNREALLGERLREDSGDGGGEESDGGEDELADSLSAGGTHSKSLPRGVGSLRAGTDPGEGESRHKEQANLGDDPKSKGDAVEQQEGGTPLGEAAGVTGANDGDLLAAKDRLKESLHYKNSDAAEWASRQKEIQRQALEVKRLKQRKKQEADRKKEMERKQKERIEELRLSQMKEERNMDLRERMRGQIRAELERVAASCYDFATLLRQLGVSVDGGSRPSVQQVNAAYKKALFKFHPDRAVASSKGDPRQQVEAEEKFKLITRLKDTLVKPVTADYGYTYTQHFR